MDRIPPTACFAAAAVMLAVAFLPDEPQTPDPSFAWANEVGCRYVMPSQEATRSAACARVFVERLP